MSAKKSSGNLSPGDEQEAVPSLLKEAFNVFSQASKQLEQSYAKLKIRADRLAKELAIANEELQKQLAEKERISNFLNNILESNRSGIVVIGPDGTVAVSNPAAETLIGYGKGAEGTPYEDLFGKSPIGRFLTECIETGLMESRSREVKIDSSGGGKHLALNFAPVINRSGDKVGSLLVVQDITRLKLLEEQQVRTSRLAAMGEVAAELAHEIRNPLGSIEIFATLLSRDIQDKENQKLAGNIVVGVKSLNAIVTNMLTFTRTIEIHPEELSVNELIEETTGFLEHVLVVQGIDLHLNLGKSIEPLQADPELLKQVLLNLAQNSVNAMEAGGKLTVSSRSLITEEGVDAVVIEINDTGCGIEPEDLPKIFDPFFSTRKGGTGLGLSVVSQIIEKHHGLITANSRPGAGTTMTITIPLHQQGAS